MNFFVSSICFFYIFYYVSAKQKYLIFGHSGNGRFNNALIRIGKCVDYSIKNNLTCAVPLNLKILVSTSKTDEIFTNIFDITMIEKKFPIEFFSLHEYMNLFKFCKDKNSTIVKCISAFNIFYSKFDYKNFIKTLLPSNKIKFMIEQFFKKKELYTALHLRWMEGSCLKSVRKCLATIYPEEICHMYPDYVNYWRKKNNVENISLYFSSDGQNKTDEENLIKIGAKTSDPNNFSNEFMHAGFDMWMIAFAKEFLANPSSSFSINCCLLREGIGNSKCQFFVFNKNEQYQHSIILNSCNLK